MTLQPNPSSEFIALCQRLRGGLIVSCQALPDEPLFGSEHMVAMARAAAYGGAAGIRANSPVDIAAIREAVDLPIIGIDKRDLPGFAVRITPTVAHALKIARAGADMIAMDATRRPHPGGLSLAEQIQSIHRHTALPVLADVSNLEEGLDAEAAGADMVSTTLAGYSDGCPASVEPDFALLRLLVDRLSIPVIAEGRISTPEQAAQALDLGAFAVVVGSAITRPHLITRLFTDRIRNR